MSRTYTVNDLCTKCEHCTKVVDYIFDTNSNSYLDKVKKVGYLCSSNIFNKKYYRRSFELLGQGCKGFKEGRIKILHNNQILKPKNRR